MRLDHPQITNDSACVYYSDILTTIQILKRGFRLSVGYKGSYLNSEPSKKEAESLAPMPWC